MGSKRSTRLVDLAQQLRLYQTDPRNQLGLDKVVAQQEDVNGESKTNPVGNITKRLKPKRAAVLICIFEQCQEQEGDAHLSISHKKIFNTFHSFR